MILSPNFEKSQSLTIRVVWQVAPSCWKTYCLLVLTDLILGHTTVSNMSRYTHWLTVPSSNQWRITSPGDFLGCTFPVSLNLSITLENVFQVGRSLGFMLNSFLNNLLTLVKLFSSPNLRMIQFSFSLVKGEFFLPSMVS